MNLCKSWTLDGTWHCKFSKSIMLYLYYFWSTFNSSFKCQKSFLENFMRLSNCWRSVTLSTPDPLGGVGFPVLVFVVDRWAIDRWVTCDLVVLWVTGLYHLSQLFGFLLTLIDVIKPMVLSHPWPVPSWSISSFSLYCLSFTIAALSLPFPVKLSSSCKEFQEAQAPKCFLSGSILQVGLDWKQATIAF